MEEFIPFLLILIAWHPDHPGKFEINRAPGAFAERADCIEAGNQAIKEEATFVISSSGAKLSFHCTQGLDSAEYQSAWSTMVKRQDEQRGAQDAISRKSTKSGVE